VGKRQLLPLAVLAFLACHIGNVAVDVEPRPGPRGNLPYPLQLEQQPSRLGVVPGPLPVIDTQPLVQLSLNVPLRSRPGLDVLDKPLEAFNIMLARPLIRTAHTKRLRDSPIQVPRSLPDDKHARLVAEQRNGILERRNLFLPREQVQDHPQLHDAQLPAEPSQ